MTNALKTDYICRVLGYPQDAFDLDIPFPVQDWLGHDDQSLINCGLYLNDLRMQFYEAVIERTRQTGGAVWLKHAEAEFWCSAFNAYTHRRLFGHIVEDERAMN